ncbi:MAG: hypothetical protein KAJ48_06505 [Elusimicrobiales bacterium]|nr:hypothetical protein [Elusimicrobiales bacterium]
MKRSLKMISIAVLSLMIFTNGAWADPFEDFKTEVISQGSALLKPFAKDLGGLIGGADFSSGRTLSFPGFDIGLATVIQFKPDSDNLVLKNAGVDAFGLPTIQVSGAIPTIGVDAVIRGLSVSGLSIVGGGLKYGVYKSGIAKFIPDVMVSAFYDTIKYDYFKGNHYSFNVSASFDIPIIKPFVGLGYDKTKLEIKNNSNTLLNGIKAKTGESRMTIGAKIIPFPFTYLFGAYSMLHGNAGAQLGLGIKF